MIKILVVDDDSTTREMVSCILSSPTCDVKSASSVIEALGLIKLTIYDLILCDIVLGGEKNGFDFFRQIQQEMYPTRFSFLTGMKGVSEVEEAMALGVDDFIRKPIDFESFNLKIERLTSGEKINTKFFAERGLSRSGESKGPVLISKISEDSMQLIFNSPAEVNERQKIHSSFFDELGITSPWYRVNACRPIEQNRYSAEVSFIGMSEGDSVRLRAWMIQNPEKRKYATVST